MIQLRQGDNFNKFLLEEKLGSGSIGHVWKARDTIIDRIVALKILDPDAEERAKNLNKDLSLRDSFLNEAKSLGKLQPKNRRERHLAERVAQVFDANIDDKTGLLYIAQEFVDGRTLADVLRTEEHSFWKYDNNDIVRQILLGLEYSHSKGVIHGDLSIHNVMITGKNSFFSRYGVKIIDFGIGALGVPTSILYLAPEVVLDPFKRSVQSDLWSVGIILYRLEHGKFPFQVPHHSLEEHDAVMTSLDDVVKTPEEHSCVREQIVSDIHISRENIGRRTTNPTARTIYSLLQPSVDRRPLNARRARLLLSKHSSAEKVLLYVLAGIFGIGGIHYTFTKYTPPNNYLITIGSKSSRVAEFRRMDEVLKYSDVVSRSDKTVFDIVVPDKKVDLKFYPDVFLGAQNSRYIVYGSYSSLRFLDVKTCNISSVPVYAISDDCISFDGSELNVLGADSRIVIVKPSTPYTARFENPAISDRGKRDISRYRIIDIPPVGVLISSSYESFVSDSEIPLFRTHKFQNPVLDNSYSGLGRLWYLENDGVQHVVDVATLSDELLKNPDEYSPRNSVDTIALDVANKNFRFLKCFGGDFFLVEKEKKKFLLRKFPGIVAYDGVEDRTAGDYFDVEGLENVLSFSLYRNDDLFYTSLVGDDTGDGRVDDSDARLYLFRRSSGISRMIGRASRVVVSSSR